MIWVLAALVIALTVALLWAVRACVRDHQADHAKCIAHVASVTSNRFVANAVRGLAERFDSVEGMADLTRIRNTVYLKSESVVSIWLKEQADKIEAPR